MSLYHQAIGDGPDVVMLHGWGLHSGVWAETATALAPEFRVTRLDLPGHGHSPAAAGELTLDGLARAAAELVPAGAHLVGWSLGGMVALRLALLYPGRVAKLVLVASTPRFVTGPGWPHGIEPEVLAGFARGLEHDYRGTLQRFLALQVQNSVGGRDAMRRLRAALGAAPAPTPDALGAGLRVLADTDLRARLADLACPVQLILGERDTLVPRTVAEAVADALPGVRADIIAGAGHAPFLSHLPEASVRLKAFLHD